MKLKNTNNICEQKTSIRPGRPIDKSRDLVILNAALELIAECGYESVTIEAIAQKAGAGKATLYRRWKSKPHLVADALLYISPCEDHIEYSKCNEINLNKYLCELLSKYFGIGNEVRQKVMLSIATSLSRDTELSNLVDLNPISKNCCSLKKVIEFSLNSDIDEDTLNMITELGPAMLFYQLIITGKTIEKTYIEQIVKTIIIPLIENQKSSL